MDGITDTDPQAPSTKSNCRILVVEDARDMRLLLASYLTQRQLGEIVPTETAEEAIKLFYEDPSGFHAILVDWDLPGMHGIELVKEIRSHGFQLPIMMLTGESRREQVQKAMESGVTDYLIKPFTKDTLTKKVDALQRQLELRRLGSQQLVRHAMTKDVQFAKPHTTIREVIALLVEHEISGMPVVDHLHEVIGIITESDLTQVLWKPEMLNLKVKYLMTMDAIVVDEDTLISDAALIMDQRRVRRFPVVKLDRLVGIIARRDLIRFALNHESELLRLSELLKVEMPGGEFL